MRFTPHLPTSFAADAGGASVSLLLPPPVLSAGHSLGTKQKWRGPKRRNPYKTVSVLYYTWLGLAAFFLITASTVVMTTTFSVAALNEGWWDGVGWEAQMWSLPEERCVCVRRVQDVTTGTRRANPLIES